jgi:hypothetical protein
LTRRQVLLAGVSVGAAVVGVDVAPPQAWSTSTPPTDTPASNT